MFSIISAIVSTVTEVRWVCCGHLISKWQNLGLDYGFLVFFCIFVFMTQAKAHLTTALELNHSSFLGEIWRIFLLKL